MDEHKQKWLNSLGLADAKFVKDCDMFARTVLMDDGSTRQMCECYTRVMGYHRPGGMTQFRNRNISPGAVFVEVFG